jgi:hypothetical protein
MTIDPIAFLERDLVWHTIIQSFFCSFDVLFGLVFYRVPDESVLLDTYKILSSSCITIKQQHSSHYFHDDKDGLVAVFRVHTFVNSDCYEY